MTLPNRREAAIIAAFMLGMFATLHIIDRVVTGVVQCSALGCLPSGGWR